MMLIQGIIVTLINRVKIGENPLREPIYEEKEIEVQNVLVAPATADDLVNVGDLEGRKTIYTIAIPKGDTNIWENQKVKFLNKTWKVITEAEEGIESMMPLAWNKKYKVERHD
ncbi:hypothetical protein ABGF48_00730 [Helcococcus bovis]|uniref:hypothetical protein n=1 Tax=Helcococcus bovis TaxID=3153252 RepID=UPI0038BDD959